MVEICCRANALQHKVASGSRCQFKRRDFVEQVLLAVEVMCEGEGLGFEPHGHVLQKKRFGTRYVFAFA